MIRSGFEKDSSMTWDGPAGGGVFGGQGSGSIVLSGDTDFVHSGLRSIRLRIWDDGNSDAVAWAGIMHTLPCERRRRVRVGAWLYFSSTIYPLDTSASAHLRVEYFEDLEGNTLIPGRVHLSPPLDISTYKADTWHQLEATDRIPPQARSLRVSVVLTAHRLEGKTEAVWLDDLYVDLYPGVFPRGQRHPDKIESSSSWVPVLGMGFVICPP